MVASSSEYDHVLFSVSSHTYLAYAVSLLKSKPHSIDLDDYFSALRSSLRSGENNKQNSAFDTGRLWRKLFQQAQSTWELSTNSTIFQTNSASLLAVKTDLQPVRKRAITNGESNKDSPKRQKLNPRGTDNSPTSTELHPIRQELLHQIGRLLQVQKKPYSSLTLDPCIDQACQTILDEINRAECGLQQYQSTAVSPTLLEVGHAAKSVISVMITTVSQLLPLNAATTPASMHSIVLLAQNLLLQLHQHSIIKAMSQHDDSQSSGRVDDDFDQRALCISSVLSALLARSLCLGLDMIKIFFDYMGSILSWLLVGNQRKSSGRTLISSIEKMLFDEDLSITIKRNAIRIQAPFLISILSSIMEAQPDSPLEVLDLAPEILSHLQRILIGSIFGHNEHEASSRANTTTKLNQILLSSTNRDKFTTATELFHEVWNIVGWDVLTSETI